MSEAERSLAVMFVDICGSTRLFNEQGNERALALTSACIRFLERFVLEQGGTMIQKQGDGFLCSFDDPLAAFKAACDMQRSCPQRELEIHSGFHFGPVIEREDTVFGDTVNTAKRLSDMAKNEEIVVSDDVAQVLPPHERSYLRPIGRIPVRGKDEPMMMYRLVLSEEDATTARQVIVNTALPTVDEGRLEVTYGKQLIVLNRHRNDLVMGRQTGCDLTVNHGFASRRHASIENRRGKYFVVDHSTNGTYVLTHDRQVVFLRRDEMQIHGKGEISLGCEPGQNDDLLIFYCEITPAPNP